jgi:hypothetical protein
MNGRPRGKAAAPTTVHLSWLDSIAAEDFLYNPNSTDRVVILGDFCRKQKLALSAAAGSIRCLALPA